MLIKTSELTGAALGYAVAIAEGFVTDGDKQDTELWLEHPDGRVGYSGKYNYSSEWGLGGPIIARECITVGPYATPKNLFKAYRWTDTNAVDFASWCEGETPLIAAMRCYVASKFGNEIEIPDGLF